MVDGSVLEISLKFVVVLFVGLGFLPCNAKPNSKIICDGGNNGWRVCVCD